MAAETITVGELIKALGTMRIHIGHSSYGGSSHEGLATYPEALARDLFREVEKHREPLYESGAAYVDAYGEKWCYGGYSKNWYAFGSSTTHPFDAPKRPLRKLMPEETGKIKLSFS